MLRFMFFSSIWDEKLQFNGFCLEGAYFLIISSNQNEHVNEMKANCNSSNLWLTFPTLSLIYFLLFWPLNLLTQSYFEQLSFIMKILIMFYFRHPCLYCFVCFFRKLLLLLRCWEGPTILLKLLPIRGIPHNGTFQYLLIHRRVNRNLVSSCHDIHTCSVNCVTHIWQHLDFEVPFSIVRNGLVIYLRNNTIK